MLLVTFEEGVSELSEQDKQQLERIRYLLDHWQDIYDPNVTSPLGTPGDGSGIALLPRMTKHPSVRELDRCLSLLASASPGDYRHLRAFRCGVEWRTVDYWRRVKLPSGRHDWKEDRKRERIVQRWINPGRVRAGEDFIVRVFRGECFIPDELYGAYSPAA